MCREKIQSANIYSGEISPTLKYGNTISAVIC